MDIGENLDIQRQIIENIKQGADLETACFAAGCERNDLLKIQAQAEAGSVEAKVFLDECRSAFSECKMRWIAGLNAAAIVTPKLYLEILERRDKKVWGKSISISDDQRVQELLSLIKSVLAPEEYEKIRKALIDASNEL